MKNSAKVQTMSSERAAWIILMVVLGISLLIVLRVLAPFFAVILLAVVTAGLVHRQYLKLVQTLRGHRHTAALILCAVLLVAFSGPVFVTAQAVSTEALGFYELTMTWLTQRPLLEELEARQQQLDRLNRYLELVGLHVTAEDVVDASTDLGVKIGTLFYRGGVIVAKGLVRLVVGFFFWLLILYYLLLDGDALKQWFVNSLPLPAGQQEMLRRRFVEMSSSLVVGNGLAGLIQGAAGGIVFAAVGLPGPVLWGVVMAILAFIPVVGMSLVFVPVALVLMLAGEINRAMLVLVPLTLVAGVVEYGVKPSLVGRTARMHTLLVFLSLIGGLDAFGPIGILVGPLMMTAFLTLVSFAVERRQPEPTVLAAEDSPEL